MKYKSLLVTLLFILPFFINAQEMSINLDNVKISFVADMQKTTGTVGGLKAKINFNMDDLTQSSISGTVEVNTLNTGNKKRDDHLKTDDFFDAAKYPTMSFTSKSFIKEDGHYIMTGIVKIKGIEREEKIVFDFKNNVFTGEATIQASNYDLGSFVKKGPEKTNVKISFSIPVE